MKAIQRYDTDVVQGPVKTILPEDRPWVLRDPEMFRLTSNPEGARLESAHTGNVFILTRILREFNYPNFSCRYNLAGGEDSEFFDRLHLLGARIFFTNRAVAYEDVSPKRFSLNYIAKRSFTQGAVYASKRREKKRLLYTLGYVAVLFGHSSSYLLRDLIIEGKLCGIPFKRICSAAGILTGLFGHFPNRYEVVDSD